LIALEDLGSQMTILFYDLKQKIQEGVAAVG
jgi:hypothetical protein